MKIIFTYLFLLVSLWGVSVDIEEEIQDDLFLATVLKVDGNVRVLKSLGFKKEEAVKGESLYQGDKLITYTNSKVVVELSDHSKVILNEGSELTFVDEKKLKQGSGEVYYKIKKRGVLKGLKVETPFSIIGIKGTEFIVESNEKFQISLNEGLVGVESLRAEFELHKKNVMADYENYKSKQMDEFKAYKSQGQEEVISYVKEFDLQPSKMLHFDDASNCKGDCESRVNEVKFTEEIEKRFEFYQSIMQK